MVSQFNVLIAYRESQIEISTHLCYQLESRGILSLPFFPLKFMDGDRCGWIGCFSHFFIKVHGSILWNNSMEIYFYLFMDVYRCGWIWISQFFIISNATYYLNIFSEEKWCHEFGSIWWNNFLFIGKSTYPFVPPT